MTQQNENLRERLLAALPQPENLAAYREETAALLAKHERALRSERLGGYVISFCAVGLFIFYSAMVARGLGPNEKVTLLGMVALFFLATLIGGLRYEIYRSQIANLKEIKQVQLQVLELQESLRNKQ